MSVILRCKSLSKQFKLTKHEIVMNKIFNLSTIPLAVTATIASVALASAPAQAAIVGDVSVAGDAEWIGFDTLEFSDVLVEDANGIFSGNALGSTVAVADLVFTPALDGTYDAVADFLTFSDGITFDLDAGVSEIFTAGIVAELDFTGSFFSAGDEFLGTGNFFVANIGNATSFALAAQAEKIPEPLTIFGTGLALGFGGLLKNKNGKKQSAEV